MMVERGWIAFAEDRIIRPCDRRVAAAEARVAASNAGTATGALAIPGAATAAAAMSEIEKKIAANPEVMEIDKKLVDLAQNMSVLQTQIDTMKKAAPPAATPAATPAAGAAAPPAVSTVATDALQKLIDGLAAERLQLDQKRTDLAVALNDGKPLSALVTPAMLAADKYAAANAALQRNMSVCKTCASLIKLDDTEERLRDHREGKLHASFDKVRTQAAAYATAHKAMLTAGTVTEAQLRAAANPPHSDRVAPAGRPSYDAPRHGSDWRGGGGGGDWRGAPQGAGGYQQHYRDPRDAGYDHRGGGYDDRRYGGSSRYDRPADAAHSSSSHRSSRRSSRSRSRSRDRERKHRRRSRSRSASSSSSGSRSRSRSSHKKSSSRSSRHHRSPSSSSRSRSRSRSRSGSRHRHKSSSSKSSKHKSSSSRRRSGSRSRSRDRKDKKKERSERSDKDKDKKRSKDDKKESKEESTAAAAAAAPEAGEIGEITVAPASVGAAAPSAAAAENKMQDTPAADPDLPAPPAMFA